MSGGHDGGDSWVKLPSVQILVVVANNKMKWGQVVLSSKP